MSWLLLALWLLLRLDCGHWKAAGTQTEKALVLELLSSLVPDLDCGCCTLAVIYWGLFDDTAAVGFLWIALIGLAGWVIERDWGLAVIPQVAVVGAVGTDRKGAGTEHGGQ